MSEKQQDLIKRPDNLSEEVSRSSEYFSRLTLADIYGNFTLKPGTTIVTDIPNDEDFDPSLFSDSSKLQALAERYGIPNVGGGSYGGLGTKWQRPFVEISAGMESPITNWAPYVFERGTIMALARSLTKSEKPLILDVGCGNGFVSKLLASDEEIKVIGVDPNLSQYEQLPYTSGDTDFRETDIVELIDEFGPTRLSCNQQRIQEIIRKLTDRLKGKEEMYYWAMQHGFGMAGNGRKFEDEVRELQKLAEKNLIPSSIDVVLCSFMRTGTDLTPAIRDGIHPKAIVYVKPMSELSGISSYYSDLETKPKKDFVDKAISFNPGRNYVTIARWQTFWANDWRGVAYSSPKSIGGQPAEVIVQVHKDTKLKKPPVSTVRTYTWDKEISEIVSEFRQYNQSAEYKTEDGFFLGMGKVALLPSDRAELTPPK